MPVQFEISVVAVAGSLRMTIPKQIAAGLSINAGDKVIVTMDNHSMIVRRKKN